jgi:hypothetical protein
MVAMPTQCRSLRAPPAAHAPARRAWAGRGRAERRGAALCARFAPEHLAEEVHADQRRGRGADAGPARAPRHAPPSAEAFPVCTGRAGQSRPVCMERGGESRSSCTGRAGPDGVGEGERPLDEGAREEVEGNLLGATLRRLGRAAAGALNSLRRAALHEGIEEVGAGAGPRRRRRGGRRERGW